MSKKVILVTGSASGIGRSLVHHFEALGHSLVAVDINASNIPATGHGKIVEFTCDVSKEDQIVKLFEQLAKKGMGLDVLLNNAAIANPHSFSKKFEDTSLEEWQRTIDVNLTGPFLMCKHATPLLRRATHKGRIINISSTRALQSEPNSSAYAASKAGLLGLSHSLAVTLGPDNILVNTILPGWINVANYQPTREDVTQHPAGRVGIAKDVALACEYLIADDNTFVTGQELVIDGGMTKKMIYHD